MLSDKKIIFPVKVEEGNSQFLVNPRNGYVTGEMCKVFVIRLKNPGRCYEYMRNSVTNIVTVPRTKEPSVDDNWLWVKYREGYLWPADGPADRQIALCKFYRKCETKNVC